MTEGDFLAMNEDEIFSAMDIDTIGEILNISMGSAATTISEMLEQKVSITTPKVEVLHSSKIHIEAFKPAIGVEINYVSGLLGKNIMVLKESDIKIIVGLLMHSDDLEKEFVLDEMNLGAICEVMNQMMGSSSTALSQFLGRPINISPPNSFKIDNGDDFKHKYFEGEGNAVMVTFHLIIGDLVDSEFISLMTVELAKELVSAFHFGDSEEQNSAPPAPEVQAGPTAAPPPSTPAQSPQPPAQPAVSAQPRAADKAPVSDPAMSISHTIGQISYPSFDTEETSLSGDQNSNLNMILSVSLQISVEIGRTTKKIKEILDFSPGTIVELNKPAGSQVDVYVNGKAIAKGDVVVVDDYYGVRITEVLSNSEIMKIV